MRNVQRMAGRHICCPTGQEIHPKDAQQWCALEDALQQWCNFSRLCKAMLHSTLPESLPSGPISILYIYILLSWQQWSVASTAQSFDRSHNSVQYTGVPYNKLNISCKRSTLGLWNTQATCVLWWHVFMVWWSSRNLYLQHFDAP